MDQFTLRRRMREIVVIEDDRERCDAQRKLYEEVLEAIANGTLQSRRLARDVLTLKSVLSVASGTVF